MKLQKEILQLLAIAAHKTFMDIVPPDMLKRSTLGTLTTDHSSQVHPTMSPFCPFPVLIAAVHFSVFTGSSELSTMFGLFQQSMLILKKIEDINGIITVP